MQISLPLQFLKVLVFCTSSRELLVKYRDRQIASFRESNNRKLLLEKKGITFLVQGRYYEMDKLPQWNN